ncbi:MAG: 50S ribosomal protein L2 [Candidatus Aenigmarchaeota archaeon]|nr:50S ribosomal protein L2 [Candidatus Aenigmarchaeota archaeon]
MGKNLRQQRRGKGTPRYTVPSHRYLGKISYVNLPDNEKGKVIDIVHSPGKLVPFAVIETNGRRRFAIAHDGAYVGQELTGTVAGKILRLKDVPEGSRIYNVEVNPGDGGRLCRSSGASASLVTKETNRCIILLPSKEKKILSVDCKATMGFAASSGRIEKPFRKAGTKHFAMKIRGKLYPHVSGVSMNAVDHPFGGQTHPGKAKTVSRHMPPGKKVGSISPRRTGRRKV